VWKVYGSGAARVEALRDVDIDIISGQFTAIMGPSGSGKSTLMHCLAGLDEVTRGEVVVAGTSLTGLSDSRLTRLRRDKVGFVFQQFNLLPTLTAEENIVYRSLSPAASRIWSGCRRSSRRYIWRTGCGIGRPTCPVVNSSGWPARGPWSPDPR
jgi:ABC-type lipoprotein export system ATPase subunit